MDKTTGGKKNKKQQSFAIDILSIDEEIVIRGVARERYIREDAVVVAKDRSGKEYPAQYSECPVYDVPADGKSNAKKGYEHCIRLPLKDHAKYSFFRRSASGREEKLRIRLGRFSRFTAVDDGFIRAGSFIIKLIDDSICVYDYHLSSHLASSFRYHKALKEAVGAELLRLRRKGLREKQRHSKPVWIVSDRTDLAGDNGEALFRFLMGSEYKDKYDIYFVIDRSSKDYDKMKSIGPVIDFGSEEHLVKQIVASAVISSSGDNWVFNPYGDKYKYLKDILTYKFVFLQHGIIKDDLSVWLHAFKKNIDIFVTSATPEYRSIIDGDYGYGGDVVKLTGLPRYDSLKDESQNIVAIMPTWRKNLAADVKPGTSVREYTESFKESEYFKFYDRLIQDERLNSALALAGYKGIFYMHPSLREQARDFTDGPSISVWRENIDYNRVFRESALMVTDYSSVAMDFAYLKKPVIYTHFDRESFFANHSYTEGYFSYEKDGFGPVVYDYESTVDAIVAALDNGCAEPEEYLERIDRFYAFTDQNNCRRVVNEIEKKTFKDARKFLISVIMPVYNVEDYLDEAIQSVIGQSIGFKDNIQIVLVNDGSPDNSADICREYQRKYPENIVFIDKENGGVSSARNEGKRHADGQFISFLDPDDIWEANAFETFLGFFEKHPEVNLASARFELFGRRNGFIHHLDYEYKKTRVVDIEKMHEFPQYSAARVMFRASAIEDLWFDEKLAIAEDMLFLNQLILREGRFGVVREAVYRYRRAEKSDSAIDSLWRKKPFYLEVPAKVYNSLIEDSVSRYGRVIRYLQCVLITDFRFRITKPHEEVLTESELAGYMQWVKGILAVIDDDIITGNRGLSLALKTDALRAKYGDEAFDSSRELKERLTEKLRMTCRETELTGTEIVMTGTAFEKYIDESYNIIASDEAGQIYRPEYDRESEPYKRRFSQGTMNRYLRRIALPADKDHTYRFRLDAGDTVGDDGRDSLRISFGADAKLNSAERSRWDTDICVVKAAKETVTIEHKDQSGKKESGDE